MQNPRVSARATRVALTLAVAATIVSTAEAQDPVIKPTITTTAPVRAPLPRNVAAVQLPDGRIQVRWSPVPGADTYQITRSVPGVGGGVVTQPNPEDTVYHDTDVVAGRTYYYVIAGLNGAGVGLKAGAPPVTATRSAGTTSGTSGTAPAAATSLTASATGGGGVFLNIPLVRTGTVLEFERVTSSEPGATWTARPELRHPVTITGGLNKFDPTAGIGAGAQLQWRVFVVDQATGARSTPTLSNIFTVPSATTTTSTTTTTTGAATSSGQVLVGISAPATVRVGSTHSLATAGSGLRWTSLDESIASVDATGTATARTAGTAQLVGIGRGTDGAVRVTVVRLTVTP